MANPDRWLKNVSQSDVARIAREKRERELRAQEESRSSDDLSLASAPSNSGGASDSAAPVKSAAPSKKRGQPLQIVGAAESEGAALLAPDAPHLRTPHEIIDRILPTLKPTSQVVLLRLYRLTAGFGSWRCQVSIPKLASACNISASQIRLCIKDLEKRKFVKRLSVDLSNQNQSERGITFEIKLPRLAPSKSVAPVNPVAPSESTAPSDSEPNKVNTLKRNTHKHSEPNLADAESSPEASSETDAERASRGVGVHSRFSFKDCQSYAEHLSKTGQGITNPGGFARTIHRTGEADEEIEKFLNPLPAPQPPVDASLCPDCNGTGYWYPKGKEHGVARCKHEKILSIIQP